MKFSFDLEKTEDKFETNKVIFTGSGQFALECVLYLVIALTENTPLEVKTIIKVLEGWEKENGKKCEN